MTISVIIPTYNSAPFLGACIDSVMNQTIKVQDIVVVDDGSTDETRATLARYGSAIRVLTQERQGPYVCRNLGAARTTGEWLGFLDADDLWEPEKVATQLARASARGVPMVYSDRYNIGERGDLPRRQSEHQQLGEGRIFADLLTRGNVITTSSVLLRRDVFDSQGGFDTTYPRAADWLMWLRVADRFEIGRCPEPLVGYRLHNANISRDTALVAACRLQIVGVALKLPSAQAFPWATKRQVWSETWRQNGWDAARHGRFRTAAGAYAQALRWWPPNKAAAAGIVKAVLRTD